MEFAQPSWSFLPSEVLSHLVSYLHVSDVLTAAKVCKNWKSSAIRVLLKVKVDGSIPFGGCWLNRNNLTQTSRENFTDIVKKALFLFINNLCDITDGVEHLVLDTNMIDSKSIEKLLLHQHGLKSLVVRYERSRGGGYEFSSSAVGAAVLKGIVKHERTLEKLNVGIEDYFIPFEKLAKSVTTKDTVFPNLKSLEFLSTTAGSFGYLEYDYQQSLFDGTEIGYADAFLEKLLKNSKLEELNFEPVLELRLLEYEWEVFWHPEFSKMLLEYFDKDSFSRLKKINVDSLNTEGPEELKWEFPESEAKIIIENCPHITHIDSDVSYDEIIIDRYPPRNDKPMIQMLKKYGTQLVFLNTPLMTTDIGKCIIENCPNIETLTILDSSAAGMTDEVFLSLSNLEKLKRVKLILDDDARKPETVFMFLENLLDRLEEFYIGYRSSGGVPTAEIFDLIKRRGTGLKKLCLLFHFLYSGDGYTTVLKGLLGIIECCQNLSSLIIHTRQKETFLTDSFKTVSPELRDSFSKPLSEMLVSKQKKLKFFHLCPDIHLELEDRRRIIDGMPYCKINLNWMIPK